MSSSLTVFSNQPLDMLLAKAEIFIKSGLVPKAYNKPEAVLVACTYGAELGFSAMQSLQVINVIEGKPCLSAAALQALALKHGGSINILEHTDKVCEVEVCRDNTKHKVRFTVDDAVKQGLMGKSNWQKMPKAMLLARATSQGIRLVFADIVGGLYTVEEMEDGKTTFEPSPKQTKPKEEPAVKAEPTSPIVEAQATLVLPKEEGTVFNWEESGAAILALYHDVVGRKEVTLEKLRDFCVAKGLTTQAKIEEYIQSKRTKE